MYDVFLSHSSTEREQTDPLFEALVAKGLTVFRDDQDVPSGAEDVPEHIRTALAQSRLLVAWASPAWWASSACQWELQTAAQVGQAEGGNFVRRVRLILPPGSQDLRHLPGVLRHNRVESAETPESRAAEIHQVVQGLRTTMVAHVATTETRWVGPRPMRSSRFVGRAKLLWSLHSLLQSPESGALMGTQSTGHAVLHGLGGMGKSLLAAEYALTFGRAFPGGVVWLEASELGSIHEAYEHVVLELSGKPFPAIPGEEASVTQARLRLALLRQLGEQPVLWVVNDPPVKGPDRSTVPVLADWKCPQAGGRTLVTQRSARTGPFAGLHVGPLSEAAALSLLAGGQPWCTQGNPHLKELCDVATRLGGHALALDVAGLLMRELGWTPAEFLEELDAQQDTVQGLELLLGDDQALNQELPTAHVASIRDTLALSYRRLGGDPAFGSSAQAVLRLTADLAEDAVPLELLNEALTALGVDQKRRQARVYGLLRQYGVARSSTIQNPEDPLEVHPLMRQVARQLWEGDGLVEMRTAVTDWMGARFDEVEGYPVKQREVEHLEAHAVALGFVDQNMGLGFRVWKLRQDRGAFLLARQLGELLVDRSVQRHGDEHPDTLTAMGNLASTLKAQGERAAARTLEEQVLTLSKRVLGAEHPDTLSSMGNLASTLDAQGEHAAARELEEQVLTLTKRVLGAEHPHTLTSMNNLALRLRGQGEYAAARVLQEQALSARKRVSGAEHPHTLRAMGNLAVTLLDEGELAAARELVEQVCLVCERVLGAEHPDTLTTMQILAAVLGAQGEHAAARGLQERILSLSERVLGAEHPDTLRSMGNLATTLLAQGEHAAARGLQERVLSHSERVLGAEHPDTLSSMNNLGSTLWAQGEYAAARALTEHVLLVRERVLGVEHSATLGSMGNLGHMLSAQGEHAAARELEEQVLSVRQRMLGVEHPDTLTAMSNLATTLLAQGEHGAARELEEQVLSARKRVLGAEHPDTLTSMNNLAFTLGAQGEYAAARTLQEQVLSARKGVLGTEHPDTLTSMNNLAITLWHAGHRQTARDLAKQAHSIALQALPPGTPIREKLVKLVHQMEE